MHLVENICIEGYYEFDVLGSRHIIDCVNRYVIEQTGIFGCPFLFCLIKSFVVSETLCKRQNGHNSVTLKTLRTLRTLRTIEKRWQFHGKTIALTFLCLKSVQSISKVHRKV